MTRSTLPPELSSRQVNQEVLEETHGHGQEGNGTISMKRNQYLEIDLSDDQYGVDLGSPKIPSRAAIHSMYLLVADVPTSRRSQVRSADSACIKNALDRGHQHRWFCR